MGISIKEIAELAGVSRGTVDRALNDRPGINPEIKARVLQVAAEHGYRSNRAGRILSIRKSPPRFGIQMPSVGNDFFLDVKAGLERAAAEYADFGLTLSIQAMKGYDPYEQVRQIRELVAEGISGLAFVPINHDRVRALLQELAATGLPVITFNTDITAAERLGYVGNDYSLSGAAAAGVLRLLAAGSPLQVLVVTGSVQILGHNQRITGFNQVLRQRCPQIKIMDIIENLDDEQLSFERMADALVRLPGLDAVYLTAGGVAGACRAIEQAGRAGCLRVISNDLTVATRYYLERGTITATIGQQPFEQGYQAVRLLFNYVLDGSRPPDHWITQNEIIILENMDHPMMTLPLQGQADRM